MSHSGVLTGESQVDFTTHPLNRNTVQYSNSSSKEVINSNSTVYSTVSTADVLLAVVDLIPNPDYSPWYAGYVRRLGTARFMELANKARAGSDTPAALFKWMLKNHKIVR